MTRRLKRPFAKPRAGPATRTLRKQPRQERAKATVEAIHEAALQVLRDVGYEKLTTTRVAERAGVSVGTLYQYYADKDSLTRALVVAYMARAERAMYAVLAEQSDLRTLARRFVRRFIAFKLEGGLQDVALRGAFVSIQGQALAHAATAAVVVALIARIRSSKPRWPEAYAVELANMWAALVFGATVSLVERRPELVAEPWFGESLERALMALLKDPPKRSTHR